MRLEYTEQVQEVLAVMEDCAQRMRYGYVGTEHLLYGLLCCEDVTAWRLLTENGADLTFVEKYLETNVRRNYRHIPRNCLRFWNRQRKRQTGSGTNGSEQNIFCLQS